MIAALTIVAVTAALLVGVSVAAAKWPLQPGRHVRPYGTRRAPHRAPKTHHALPRTAS
ncbi:hypothetical protein NE236_41555 [Actinoallomurus purpureus]|uniref:hypothetical protein n=1 Tax=Actinoallomurus purpureus TaxID=478114 RepID=UPI0020932295|nr:hypothetical protein [Actinoallomurus purpureus]MCO6011456.1 hypothetical protein [Actinoallomurus purpureus]